MKTAYITEPSLNLKWAHTSGTSDVELARSAYKKLFDDTPKLANMLDDLDIGQDTISDLREYHTFTLNDTYIANDMEPVDNDLSDIIPLEIKPVNAHTPLATNKVIKSISTNPTSMINKDLIIFTRPKLYQTIRHDVGILLKDKRFKNIQELLAYMHAAEAEIMSGYEPGRKLAMLKRYISYDTLKNYALFNKIKSPDFKKVTIIFNPLSIYTYRFKIDKKVAPSVLRTTMALINDLVKYNDVDDILKNRFDIDRQKTIKDELQII